MRFFQAAVLIFGLSSAACAMLDQAGHPKADLEARLLEANELEALYQADLERRDPGNRIDRRPGKQPKPSPECKKTGWSCSIDKECCSKICKKSTGYCA
ncbi:hypothetical protein LX36DRAFT_660820 [Colletotrichum falcatum]|nr:hypothetical protein LX36DRAFT_660820 [Colletotrichum falcatum]